VEYHDILGIRADASEAEIHAAFRKRAKEVHPDHGGDSALFDRVVKARKAALAGAKSAAFRTTPPKATHAPHYEPEVRRGPTTAFRTGSVFDKPNAELRLFGVDYAAKNFILSLIGLNRTHA
jgi:hypothetical protein